MWPNKSPKLNNNNNNKKKFSCTSFKDIQLLISDENNNNIINNNNKLPLPRSGSIFHRVKLVNSLLRSWSTRPQLLTLKSPSLITLPNTENTDGKVVIYYTSLRVVRKTSDDCRTVRSILNSFNVKIDERDVSMDNNYITELHRIFSSKKTALTLPKVFIGDRFIGGAEEVRNLHESGELKAILSALPVMKEGGICKLCGGIRFVLCEECNGSRKCYWEKGGFRTCGVCNENGLVRCSSCT